MQTRSRAAHSGQRCPRLSRRQADRSHANLSPCSPSAPTTRNRPMKRTLARSVALCGVGLHSAAASRVVLRPAQAHEGVYFVRTDLPHPAAAHIPARPRHVVDTRLCTVLGSPHGPTVATVEHLMAALCGSGVGACRVEVDAPELPLLDGSAAPWVAALGEAGSVEAEESSAEGAAAGGGMASASAVPLARAVCVQEGEAWVVALPSPAPRLTYGIDFPNHAPIGRQWFSWAPGGGASFAEAVAPARTFGLLDQIDALREAGLIQGGSLENALVCNHTSWLNGPLRFANEPVRHKLLDLLGDLALLGGLPMAHVIAYRASHRLHVQLANHLERLYSSSPGAPT